MKLACVMFLPLMLSILSACTTVKSVREETNYIECTDPRPQICTREYRPVCARVDTRVRCVTTPCPSTRLKTYGNACSACGDKKVYGYIPGECQKDPALK